MRRVGGLVALGVLVLAGCAADRVGGPAPATTTALAPSAVSVAPGEGPSEGGTLISIRGANLPGDAVVSFPDGAPFDTGPLATAVAVDASGSTLTCVTPAGEPGRLAPILIRSLTAGSVVLPSAFRYLTGPIARAASPAEGPMRGGTALTITGERFEAPSAVRVGGAPATGVRVSADRRTLTCVTPPRDADGPVDVEVVAPGRPAACMAAAFRYRARPAVRAVEPPAGPQRGGTRISISGEGFRGEVAVLVGGLAASEVAATADGRTVTCRTPARGGAGAVDVAVSASITGAVTATAAFTYAAAPWERPSEGLEGSDVTALAFGSASVVYAGTALAGVFRSADGGVTWGAASAPAGRGGAFAAYTLMVEPGAPGTVYAAGFASLARSEDGGATWTALDAALPVTGTSAAAPVAVDPADPDRLLAAFTGGGLFRSTDRGASWTDVSAAAGTRDITALALDPLAPAAAYAGASDGRVLRSADGGATWSATGLAAAGAVLRILVHETTPGTVFALAGGTVYRTRDAGATWSAAGAGLPGGATELELAAGDVLYAAAGGRVYRSGDGASSWQLATAGIPRADVNDLAAVPGSATAVLAGASIGVLLTSDGGGGWALSQRGLAGLALTDVIADAATPGRVYAAADRGPSPRAPLGGGVFVSEDHGLTWAAARDGLEGMAVTRLAQDAVAPGALIAATAGAVYRTGDAARTWAPGAGLPGGGEVTALRFDPRAAGTAYASNGARVFRTLDAGATWVELAGGLRADRVTDLVLDARGEPALLAANAGGGVQRFRDGTWSDVSAGLARAPAGELAIGPGADLLVMLGGPYRAAEPADGWTASDTGIAPRTLELLVSAASDRTVMFAASRTAPPRLYRSADGGRTWRDLTAGYPGAGPIARIAVDPRTPDIAYVAHRDGALYRTVTGGE